MTPRRVHLCAIVALALAPWLGHGPANAAGCDGLAYRIETASEVGESWSFRLCGKQALGALLWARAVPGERGEEEPAGDLGPRLTLVIERVEGGSGRAIVRQDYYPDADGGPVVFAAPGQIFSHRAYGGIYTVSTGWATVTHGGIVPFTLRDLGAPIPFPSPPTAAPSGASTEPPVVPTEDLAARRVGGQGPDLVTLVAVGAVAAIVALLVIRRRSGS